MKTLYLVRHAKSSWKEKGLADKDRPLNKRGAEYADMMVNLLKKVNNIPDSIITSPAKRASDTAIIFSKGFFENPDQIQTNELLYMADYEDFISVIKEVKEEFSKMMLFSHNPGITFFACAVSNADIENIPTCGIVRIDFNIDSWKNISTVKGEVVFFEYPKKYTIENE